MSLLRVAAYPTRDPRRAGNAEEAEKIKLTCGLLKELQTDLREVLQCTEKAPTRAYSWLKVTTTAFTYKTLLRHYAKRALTPQ